MSVQPAGLCCRTQRSNKDHPRFFMIASKLMNRLWHKSQGTFLCFMLGESQIERVVT
jgi:hypothetical protein